MSGGSGSGVAGAGAAAAAAAAVSVHVDAARVAELTSRLIRFDTTNPPGSERECAEFVGALLAGLGCAVRYVEPSPGRASVIARYGSGEPGRPVLLVNGHLDVVPAIGSEWTWPPFAGTIRDGLVLGRGAADMKGGVAAAIEALQAVRESGLPLESDLLFHFVADEETGAAEGTAALMAAGELVATACLVPEPSSLGISVAERGALFADIEVHGRPAHGSQPQLGVSAIEGAATVVRALHRARFAPRNHPLLGEPTCNVGTIAGGTSRNIVASSAVLGVDRRFVPGETAGELMAELEATVRASAGGDALELDFRQVVFVDASELPAVHPFVDLARSVLRGAGGLAAVSGSTFGTDARFMRELGIPTIVYGPGSVRQAHTADESVTIASLVTAAQGIACLYLAFGEYYGTNVDGWAVE